MCLNVSHRPETPYLSEKGIKCSFKYERNDIVSIKTNSTRQNFEFEYLLKCVGEFLREFWEILEKYHILDGRSAWSKGLKTIVPFPSYPQNQSPSILMEIGKNRYEYLNYP